MRPGSKLNLLAWPILAMLLGMGTPRWVQTQEVDPEEKEAYFRAVSEYFRTPLEEVTILSEWDLNPDEVPVVLFLAQQAGVSPDALIGLRRSGRGWQEVGRRFGVQTLAFHVPLPREADKGPLSSSYDAFETRPSREWPEIPLADADIIALVNLRVLSAQTKVPPIRVLQLFQETGSFVSCYPRLIPRSGS